MTNVQTNVGSVLTKGVMPSGDVQVRQPPDLAIQGNLCKGGFTKCIDFEEGLCGAVASFNDRKDVKDLSVVSQSHNFVVRQVVVAEHRDVAHRSKPSLQHGLILVICYEFGNQVDVLGFHHLAQCLPCSELFHGVSHQEVGAHMLVAKAGEVTKTGSLSGSGGGRSLSLSLSLGLGLLLSRFAGAGSGSF